MFRQYTTETPDLDALKEELHPEFSGWMGQEAFGQLVRAVLSAQAGQWKVLKFWRSSKNKGIRLAEQMS